MTPYEANHYFETLPEGFAPAEELRAALPAAVQQVQFVGVAGTAGKTATAGLLGAILQAAGFVTGLYHAGCEPLAARIRVQGAPVDEVLFREAAEKLSAAKPLPRAAAELAAAAICFGAAGCKLAVVELPDAGLAAALPAMPVCAVTAIGPDGISRSVERSAALAAGVMREGSVCVTAPEQPKAVLSELIVAAGKCNCELVVPDPGDITFLEAEKFTSKVDYGGYTVPLAFLGRHAAGNAAIAVEMALALWRKGFEIPDEAILAGLAAVENRSSIRVLSQKPLIILDACRTPQQAAALLRVLNMAKVRHMSAVIGLTEEEGAESFLAALETGLTSEEQKKDKSTMPGMGENPFDRVFLVAPAGTEAALAERLTEKARYHFDAVFCPTLAEAVAQVQRSVVVPKARYNAHGNFYYRSMEDIVAALKEPCKDAGIAFTLNDSIVQIGERYYVEATCRLFFEDGHGDPMDVTAYAREPLSQKGMNEAQVTGSASSYARKYALCGAFDIDGTSDPDTLMGTEKPAEKEPPEFGQFIAKCKSCGTSYQFESRQQYEQFKANPGCCPSPAWQVV